MNNTPKKVQEQVDASNRIRIFKEKSREFSRAWAYILVNENEFKKDPRKWKTIQKNLETKYELPLTRAWEALTEEEKLRFGFMYLYRRETAAQEKERINRVLKIFNGRII